MALTWQSLDSKREISYADLGVVLVRPKDKGICVPLFCPLCKFPNKTADDSKSFREHGVCFYCELHWYMKYQDQWNDSNSPWRPDKESQAWKDYVALRQSQAKPVILFR